MQGSSQPYRRSLRYQYRQPALRKLGLHGFHIPSDEKALTVAFRISLALLTVLFVGQAVAMPLNLRADPSGLEVLALPFGARLAEALIAVVAVGLVTLVYSLLIHRGALIATTCLYPRRPIESNIGRLLDAAWPASRDAAVITGTKSAPGRQVAKPESTIQLFYLGKMQDEPKDVPVAKCRKQSIAEPLGEERRGGVWLTSGSQLTKSVVQVMVWEWVSLWLCALMLVSSLMFNGFFTGTLNHDSFPRLTVMMIYVAAFSTHFFYIWIVFLDFFSMVFVGASWSLLERAKFVVGEPHKLREHPSNKPFRFRSIDKANEAYIPTTFTATLGGATAGSIGLPEDTTEKEESKSVGSSAELSLALGNINASQKTEREQALEAARLALERVIANVMVMMAVTLSSGFASWTSGQFTEDTPNNTATNQIGSLALLGSLSLGAAAMFSSAMHLSIMASSFRTIVSLKETKINGLALEHHRKTRAGIAHSAASGLKSIAFTLPNGIKPATIELADFFAAKASRGWSGILSLGLLGPGYALLPQLSDYDRRSAEVDFDFVAPLGEGKAVLTTRRTDQHARGQGDGNLDPVVTCYVPGQGFGKEPC